MNQQAPKRVLIIGGYGTFGSLIAAALAPDARVQLIIAGRSLHKAQAFCDTLNAANQVQAIALDVSIQYEHLKNAIGNLEPDIIIHTSGPFQGQDYRVAEAALHAGAHYIDLADGRRFVSDIGTLSNLARAKDLMVVTGASSVPSLSSAVIEHFKPAFKNLESIEYGITTAQKTPRGLATTKAILSYIGRPFPTLINGDQKNIVGWQDLKKKLITNIGIRRFANCDIPDLEILPKYYPDLKAIRFRAGLELSFLTLGMQGLGALVRLMPAIRLERAARPLLAISNWLNIFGSKKSGFYMILEGRNSEDKPHSVEFQMWALDGHGLHIPTIPAIFLTRKIINGTAPKAVAMPCVGLIKLDEYLDALRDLNIGWSPL